jgi:hypothetical protein
MDAFVEGTRTESGSLSLARPISTWIEVWPQAGAHRFVCKEPDTGTGLLRPGEVQGAGGPGGGGTFEDESPRCQIPDSRINAGEFLTVNHVNRRERT